MTGVVETVFDTQGGVIASSGYGGPAFVVSSHWSYREGCGHGVRQSHAVGVLEWRSPGSRTNTDWFGLLAPLLDEPLAALPPQPMLLDWASWLAGTLGALLRGAGFATARDAHAELQPVIDPQVQSCLLVLPIASPKASMTALRWLLSCLNDPPAHAPGMQARFFALHDALRPLASRSANHWRTLQAAYDERYPVLALAAGGACIGTGVHRRWFDSFVTDRTPYLSMQWAQDKQRTARMLRANGFPGAINCLAGSAQQAREAAEALGFPVVVKPNDRDRGEGVCADIVSVPQLLAAYDAAAQHSPHVLVEKFQPGFTHRFSVVQGKVLRVAKHVAFGVTGDGRSSVEQLVAAQAQTLEEQKRALRRGMALCVLDDEAQGLLHQHGLHSQYVPAAGEYVRLRRKDNVSAGGQRFTLDLTTVHLDNVRLAVHVSELLGLDFAGVDLISPDVTRSWRELPATICEVNGNPQLVARDDPDMYKRVLRHVMPAPFRVPVQMVLLLAPPDAATQAGLVRRFAAAAPGQGLALPAGIWLGGEFVAGPFESGYAAAASLCANPHTHEITFVLTLAELLHQGLVLAEVDLAYLPSLGPQDMAPAQQRDYAVALALLRPHVKNFYQLTL